MHYYYHHYYSQQQNALGYNLSMQGIGTVAIDGPRFEELLRSHKEFFEVSQGGVSQGGLARILLLGCTAGLIIIIVVFVIIVSCIHSYLYIYIHFDQLSTAGS